MELDKEKLIKVDMLSYLNCNSYWITGSRAWFPRDPGKYAPVRFTFHRSAKLPCAVLLTADLSARKNINFDRSNYPLDWFVTGLTTKGQYGASTTLSAYHANYNSIINQRLPERLMDE